MKIPVFENQVDQQSAGTFNVPSPAAPSPGAFGTGIAEATQRLGSTVASTSEDIQNHILERERQMQTAQVTQADNQFRTGLQKQMFDTSPDPKTGIPKGVFNRMGLSAQGATEEFDQDFANQRQSQVDAQDTPYKKQRLGELMDENYPRLRELVAKHEGTQVREGQTAIVVGHNNLAMQNAPQYVGDSNGLIKSVETEQQLLHDNLMSNGVPVDKISAQINDLAGNIVKSSMRSLLNENPDGAQKFFDQITENKNNPLSLKDQDSIQKIIDDSQRRHKEKTQKYLDIHTNENEADLGSKLANGDLTQMELDGKKNDISRDYYNLASKALQNKPGTVGTPDQQTKAFVSMMQKYAAINESTEPDKRVAALIKFRKEVIAEQTRLPADGFKHLLGWTDPNFVEKQIAPNVPWYKSALNFITDHADKYGTDAKTAIADFMSKSSNAAPQDIPAIAQQAAKSSTVQAHPALNGQPDVSNNIIDQKKGITQTYGQETMLKPSAKLNQTVTPPYGKETVRNGKKYMWSTVDNKYHLKGQ